MKIFTGTVKSTKMQKTASVVVNRVAQHRLYGKRLKKRKVYQVHDEIGAKEGDRVRFVATKVYSKTKKWKIVEIVGAKPKVEVKTKKKVKKSVKKTK